MYELATQKDLHDELETILLCSENPIVLSRKALSIALQRVIADQVDQADLIAWANLIEARDEVQYEPGFEKMIADVVFYISSPEINGALSKEVCHLLLVQHPKKMKSIESIIVLSTFMCFQFVKEPGSINHRFFQKI